MLGFLRQIKRWFRPLVLPSGISIKYPDKWTILKKFNKYTKDIEYRLLVYYYAGIRKPRWEVTTEILSTKILSYFYEFRTANVIYKAPKTGEIVENEEIESYFKVPLITFKEYTDLK